MIFVLSETSIKTKIMERYIPYDDEHNDDDLQQPEQEAGIEGLGDRSSSDDLNPGRTGAGEGYKTEGFMPMSGDPDEPLDEEEDVFREDEADDFKITGTDDESPAT
jgi:hypothetical protein